MFTRNMFIMLLSIMVGAVLITYFVADIQYQSEIDTLSVGHIAELTSITSNNENFTGFFLQSLGLLDQSREGRAYGNYHYDLAFLWHNSALSEKNSTTFQQYKDRAIDNCTNAMPNYVNSYNNFLEARNRFIETKNYTNTQKYQEVLDLYIQLSESGAKLTMLRYNASNYLKQITTEMELKVINNTISVFFTENMTLLLGMFEDAMGAYGEELGIFEGLQDDIDEYPFFDEIR